MAWRRQSRWRKLVSRPYAYAICGVVGAEIRPDYTMPSLGKLAFQFVFILIYIGLGKKPDWRGFLLPRMLLGRTAVAAALIVGAVHMVWHLPLLGVEYDATNLLPWVPSVFCYSIVITWVHLHTVAAS